MQGVVNERTNTPLTATLVTGLAAGFFALLLDLEVLADLVSVGSLVCFLLVNAACVWRRYAWVGKPAHPDSTLSRFEDHLQGHLEQPSVASGSGNGGGLAAAMEASVGPMVKASGRVRDLTACGWLPIMYLLCTVSFAERLVALWCVLFCSTYVFSTYSTKLKP